MAFDIVRNSQKMTEDPTPTDVIEKWRKTLLEEGRAAKAQEAGQRALQPAELEALARKAFEQVSRQALDNGVKLGEEDLLMLFGDLSGLGPLLELISRPDVEDVALNLGHIYVYTTTGGWEHVGNAAPGTGDAIRVLIDRAGQIAPTPDHPIADAMIQVMIPTGDGIKRKGVRINYIMQPASPYGDTITLRISNYRTGEDIQKKGNLALLCSSRLPAITRPIFRP